MTTVSHCEPEKKTTLKKKKIVLGANARLNEIVPDPCDPPGAGFCRMKEQRVSLLPPSGGGDASSLQSDPRILLIVLNDQL